MTLYWKVEPDASHAHPFLLEAGKMIAEGGTVAFPTETVYGLGADARNTEAVEAVFRAKGRPADNPLIVHIADRRQLDGIVRETDGAALRLMDAFWPGPLTIVLPAAPGALSPRVTAGLPTVGVRMPAHPVALALIRAAGCPVAAPSANRSGRPSPTNAAHVREDLDGRIGGIVDGGPAGVGLESTVVIVEKGLTGGDTQIRVLRPGGVTVADLRRELPGVPIAAEIEEPAEGQTPRSPGMKYAHYAPKGRLTIVEGSPERVADRIRRSLSEAKRNGERTGVLAVRERADLYDADVIAACGSANDPEEAARNLYAALRRFDEAGVTCIWAEQFPFPPDGIGLALANRLSKAAGHRIERV